MIKSTIEKSLVLERINLSTEWLDKPPAMVRRRLPYRLIWMLELDAPKTAHPLYGYKSKENVYLYRNPEHFKTAFQPNADVSFKASDGGCELHLDLTPFKDAVIVAKLTSGVGLCMAMIGLGLIPKIGLMALGFTAIALAIVFLNRTFTRLFFNGEVDNLEESVKGVINRSPPKR
ncbi:MAG: hypothetical protein CMH52_14115 [Myxococcales bacterium]|nr:hypothetical protein [Myxococcales bacterium]